MKINGGPCVLCQETGTSLLELLVATAAGLVVLAAAMQTISNFHIRFADQQSALGLQQDLRLGLELLTHELHLTTTDDLLSVQQDEIEFAANLNGLSTMVTTSTSPGQTTITVEDGREWPERKTIRVCWFEQCESMVLAR